MKKNIQLIIFLILISLTSLNAQIDSSKYYLSLNCNLNALISSLQYDLDDPYGLGLENERKNLVILNFSPKVGYILNDRFLAGIFAKLTYDYSEQEAFMEKRNLDQWIKNMSYTIGPFAKIYMTNSKIRPFLELSAGFGSSETKLKNINNDYHWKYLQEYRKKHFIFGSELGTDFFISDHFALELGIQYTFVRSKHIDENDILSKKITSG